MALSMVLLLVLQAKPAPAVNLKTVELAGKYTIQVPAKFAVQRQVWGSAPAITFVSDVDNRRTQFDVTVERLSTNETFDAGEGQPHFTISGGGEVYYRWHVVDNAYECTMNSPCPLPVQARIRYMAVYKFRFFDKPNNTVVVFEGTHSGPSKEVTGFEGVGKLLRDVIVPSLTPIHQASVQDLNR